MAHAWWRDCDYELFDRLKRENAKLREALLDIDRMAEIAEMPWPPGGQHVGVKKWNMARSTAIEVRKAIRSALTPTKDTQ